MKRMALLFAGLLMASAVYARPDDHALQTYRFENSLLGYNDNMAVVFEMKRQVAHLVFMNLETCPADWCNDRDRDSLEESYSLLSIVGPIVSYRGYWYMEGGAHPNMRRTFNTIDMTTLKPASLLSYFHEKDILNALLRDSVLRQTLPKGRKIETLKDYFKSADGACVMKIDESMLSAFAFHHIKGDRVAVRIGISHDCELDRGKFTEIGIYLPIPHILSLSLTTAQKEGKLMEQMAKKRGNEQVRLTSPN